MIKKYILELSPVQFDLVTHAVDNYHTFLHDAKRFKHDIRLSRQHVNRFIVVSHGMLATLEQEAAYTRQSSLGLN